MNQVVYGLHTGQAKKQISYREAKAIEMIFQKAFPDEAHSCSQFFHKGISKFWIEEVTNKAGKRYWMHLKVNMARAIAVSEYGLMPYTVSNVKKLIRETSKLLKKLKLDDRNADFSIWRWERFDCGFDVSVEHPEIFMSLLDKSIYVNAAKKRCRRIAFTPANSNACESIRFGNDSYTYNVYIKLAGLINKGIAITPDIHREVDNIVRVERQNHLSVIKQIVPKCEVGGLASNKTMNLILKTLTDDIEAFWGKGDYYSSNAIRSKYRSIPDVARLIPAMVEFTANSLDDRQHLYTADIKESFQEYGIMPVGICKDDAHKYQIQEIKGLYNMVTDCYAVPDKRAYHEFPVFIHGGGYANGDKSSGDPNAGEVDYRDSLAYRALNEGYNVVQFNYCLMTEHIFPDAIIQLNSGLKYLKDHADDLNLNMDAVFLSGGSAGGNLAGVMANL